ncbi:MAG TPA: hypothetical protein VLS48_09035, partial [Anaerolineales bacterium]|nr:hypothetical protein [Anaerolineales bacterium]
MTDAEPFLPPEGEQNDAAPPEDAQNARTIRFLLTSLIIVGIFILTLFFLIFAYPLVLAPAPTATPTITPTRRATVTPAPFIPTLTSTATPRITRTPLPTFTATPSL